MVSDIFKIFCRDRVSFLLWSTSSIKIYKILIFFLKRFRRFRIKRDIIFIWISHSLLNLLNEENLEKMWYSKILKIHYLYYLSTSDDVQGPRNGLYLGEAWNFFLSSIKISHCKNSLVDWPNLDEASASVLHRFCGAWWCGSKTGSRL